MLRLGTRLSYAVLGPSLSQWEVSAFMAMISQSGATMPEVKVESFQPKFDLWPVLPDVCLLWGLPGAQVVYFDQTFLREEDSKKLNGVSFTELV